MPAADLMESGEEDEAATGNHNSRLNRIGIGDRGEATHHGDDGDDRSDQYDRGHQIPTEETMQYERTGI